jgi:hypothetical protein
LADKIKRMKYLYNKIINICKIIDIHIYIKSVYKLNLVNYFSLLLNIC